MRVLLVEDEARLAALLRRGLTEEGLLADVAATGEDAVWMAQATAYDALVLDVNLPGIDGFEACRRLRDRQVRTPVLMLTARDAVEDRITGLDTGADDYLVKPFDFGELLARLRALARRGPARHGPVLEAGDLRLDPATRRVERAGVQVELSTKEFQLLEVFMRHPGRVLSRLDLLEGAWDSGYENRSNVVDVYVRYLREKLDRPFGARSFETVRGAGYRFNPQAADHP
jgi:two-component system OmpR family response regulator